MRQRPPDGSLAGASFSIFRRPSPSSIALASGPSTRDSLPMTEDDQLHLATAHGFVKRKEWLEAHAALEGMSPELRTAPEVLALKVVIFHGLARWEMMEIVAKDLVNGLPGETYWMVTWIIAKRKLDGDELVDSILGDYIPALGTNGMTHYALGKLAFSMGDDKTASAFFKRAFTIAPELRLRALDDVELDRYWEGLGGSEAAL
jgi:hypothetical protein